MKHSLICSLCLLVALHAVIAVDSAGETAKQWRLDLNQLIEDTRHHCSDAKSSNELEPLLERCKVLQKTMEKSRDDVVSKRSARRLEGVASTLSYWTEYLDCREIGNIKRANQILDVLSKDTSIYPILDQKDIDSRYFTIEEKPRNWYEAIPKIYEGLKSCEDLPTAIERVKASGVSNLKPVQEELERHWEVWNFAKAGKGEMTKEALQKLKASALPETTKYLFPLWAEISDRLLKNEVKKWSKLEQRTDENTLQFIDRTLSELQAKNDYAGIVQFWERAVRLNPEFQFQVNRIQYDMIKKYLTAQRFEKAGDLVAAVNCYRQVVNSTAGKYVPLDQSVDALKRIHATNPEAFKSYEGVLLDQLEQLQQQFIFR